jgi:hypothetical protein
LLVVLVSRIRRVIPEKATLFLKVQESVAETEALRKKCGIEVG